MTMELNIKQLKVDMGAGAGSRGGHVIGKTSSGKPIYANAKHPKHAKFKAKDHDEARDLHAKLAREHPKESMEHGKQAGIHREAWQGAKS